MHRRDRGQHRRRPERVPRDQRVQLRTLLDSLGNGLRDRGASLRTAFVELVPLLRIAGNISDQLAARAPLVRRLVHNTATLTAELGGRQQQLRTLLDAGSAVLATLQASSGNLGATLDELPPTLSELQSSFATVRNVLPRLDTASARFSRSPRSCPARSLLCGA